MDDSAQSNTPIPTPSATPVPANDSPFASADTATVTPEPIASTPAETPKPEKPAPQNSTDSATTAGPAVATTAPVPAVTSIPAEPAPPAATTEEVRVVADEPKKSKGGGGRKKMVAGLVGILVLLGSVGVGLFLVSRQQQVITKAWVCSSYNFSVLRSGEVKVINTSATSTEPFQRAIVYIDDAEQTTFDVEEIAPNSEVVLGNVTVPAGGFSWRVEGTSKCSNEGTYDEGLTLRCTNITAYDDAWTELTATDLTNLAEGDVVRFVVRGTASAGSFTKARFSINSSVVNEETTETDAAGDFYYEYIIPAGETTFTIDAQLYHAESNKWV